MKLLLPPCALLLLSGTAPEKVALTFAPDEGTTLKRTFEAEAQYQLSDVTYSIDGDAVESPGERPEFSMHFKERIAVTDELAAVADGRPTELVRRFDDLHQDTTLTVGDEEHSSEAGSELEGRAVRFTWNDDDEAYRVAAADDQELDETLSAWLAEDMDLRGVLPPGEVEVGDEWELDPKLYLAFMWPSGLLEFRDEGEEISDADRSMNQATIERLEGKGTAKLEEVREEDGLLLAQIHVELEITTGCGNAPEGEEAEGQVQVEVAIERTLSGTILWEVEHGHAHSAELEAQATRRTTRSGKVETDDGEVELGETEVLEGTIQYHATIEHP